MRRGPLIAAVAVVVLTALLAVVTNWATDVVGVPGWLANPAVIVLLGVVIVLLLVVAGVLAGRQPETPPAATAMPRFTTVAPSLCPPPPGPVFGRANELAALTAPRREPVLDVVCAGGGTGKTTLARELARLPGARSFWIDWRNDPEVLATSMVEVARTLGLAPEKVAQAQRAGSSLPDLVWTHLASVYGWLVVVDNIDDIDVLQSGSTWVSTYRGWLRPTGCGQLVVTSRLQDPELWGPQARMHRIGRLSTADAATALHNLAPHGGEGAEELAERLGGHPLALRAAGRAVGTATSAWPTFAAYLAALQEQRISVLPDAPHATDPETARRLVGHTWEVSLDQLAVKPGTRLARPLLRALSMLAQAPIPRGLITPALLPDSPTEVTVNEALAGLDRYGLLEPTAPGGVLLHPLVRETSAKFLAKEADLGRWRERVEARVVAFVDETTTRERQGWNDARLLVPHVLSLRDPGTERSATTPSTVRLAWSELAEVLRKAGAYALQLQVLERALRVARERDGAKSRVAVQMRQDIGYALLQLGDPAAAETRLRDAVNGAVAHHPDLALRARHILAIALVDLGNTDEAVTQLEAVRDSYLAEHGPDDPRTLNAVHNLAGAMSAKGMHQRASDLLQQVVADRRRTLGVDHADTTRSVLALATTLSHLGMHHEAAALEDEGMGRYEKFLGAEHPETLLARRNLAANRYSLGDYNTAADQARLAVRGYKRTFGPNSPHTTAAEGRLATYEEALRASSLRGRLRARLRR